MKGIELDRTSSGKLLKQKQKKHVISLVALASAIPYFICLCYLAYLYGCWRYINQPPLSHQHHRLLQSKGKGTWECMLLCYNLQLYSTSITLLFSVIQSVRFPFSFILAPT